MSAESDLGPWDALPVIVASTGPRSCERGEPSLVTPSAAGPQPCNCDSLRSAKGQGSVSVQSIDYYFHVIKYLRHASDGGVSRITPPLAD